MTSPTRKAYFAYCEPVRGLMSYTGEELRMARGNYRAGETMSANPCIKCGKSAHGCGCPGVVESCEYCKRQGFSSGFPKVVGNDCSICTPRNGKYPRKTMLMRTRRSGGKPYESSEIIYDLDQPLP